MIPLPTVHPDMRTFASAARPLRPSKTNGFAACPMSVVLSMWDESKGGRAADTGSLVHAAVEAFHRTTGADRVAAGQRALTAAREKFPAGDEEKAAKIYAAYAADPENIEAKVTHCEAKVRLTLPPAPEDPTQEAVVIAGTLDQIRVDKHGIPRVWDVKTGDAKDGPETLTEYAIQQAVYTLAARESIDARVEVGGILYTPGYMKARGKVHLPLTFDVETCKVLVSPLVHWVALIRKGVPVFRPSAANCTWCTVKPWPSCREMCRGVYGV